MPQLFQQNELEALLNEYQEARAFLKQYPHILDAILNQIAALQSELRNRSLQEVKYETNKAVSKPFKLNPSLIFYIEPVCPECGTALITDPANTDKLLCPECSQRGP